MQTATDDPEVQIVMAWDRNRIERPKDAADGMLLERQILKAGKRVVYAATGRETDQSFESGLMDYIEHHQNGDYLRKLSRDTMRGIVSRVQRGLWLGGSIPFGNCSCHASGQKDKCPKRYNVPAQVVEDHVTTPNCSDLEKHKGDKKLAELVQKEQEKLFGRNTMPKTNSNAESLNWIRS